MAATQRQRRRRLEYSTCCSQAERFHAYTARHSAAPLPFALGWGCRNLYTPPLGEELGELIVKAGHFEFVLVYEAKNRVEAEAMRWNA